jgi:type III secretory pathway component EscS
MEYLGMFASYFGTSLVTTRLILKQDEVSSLGKTFAQAGIIAAGMLIFTLLLNMLRAYRVCTATGGQKKSLGVSSGFVLSMWAIIFATTIFVLMSMFTPVTSIITAILPFLKDYVGVVLGLGVAIFGILGYWFGRIFTSLC